jgi:hypothetical protein
MMLEEQKPGWNGKDRRRLARLPNHFDIFVRDGQKTFNCKTFDVNPFGVGLDSDRALPVGAKVDLSIFIMETSLNFDVKAVVRHCRALQAGLAEKEKYLVGVELTEGNEKALPFVEKANQDFQRAVNQSVVINADIKTVYEKLIDIEREADWAPDLKSAKALERYPDGKCKRAEFEHVFMVLKTRYISEYTYNDQNYSMNWKYAGGDSLIRKNDGGYTLKAVGTDKTMVTFFADITLSLVPSRRILDYFSTIGLRKALKSFKNFVENDPKAMAN